MGIGNRLSDCVGVMNLHNCVDWCVNTRRVRLAACQHLPSVSNARRSIYDITLKTKRQI